MLSSKNCSCPDRKARGTLVTVIVPVYEHWGKMPEFIERMEGQTLDKLKWELLVVDNGSSNVPAGKDLPEFVTLLACSTPGSYAARNVGLRMAKGELLLFTDADCMPSVGWIESHWNAFIRHGAHTLNAGAVTVAKLTAGPPNDYELYDSFLGIPQERYVKRRGYAVTANLAVPREVFEKVGGFDEKRFSGGDAEFCQRASKAGFKLCYVPEAEVLHPARSTWADLETKARRVKGGQICNGPLLRRVSFFLKSFIYPLAAAFRVCLGRMPGSDKKRILAVVLRLGAVEIREVLSLTLGKAPERR